MLNFKMIAAKVNILELSALFIILIVPIFADEPQSKDNKEQAFLEAVNIAQTAAHVFIQFFAICISTSMPNQQFISDNLQKYVNSPAKTTVGFAPKFTSNRKFFANMITTTSFKEMLTRDEEEFRYNTISKIKYCDNAIMDQNHLKDFYDREVDQSKI